MSFPISDWQFWIVTPLAALGACWVLRRLLPGPVNPFRRRTGTATTLTINGRPLRKPGKPPPT
ncbi:MAG: hypothetical protein DYG92_10030 [Leptolyngbya sp. PLA1]|nr:hypothetical protein [Leptolyngbya sp. PLA1]